MEFSHRLEFNPNHSSRKFNFYLDKIHIGQIIYYINYIEVSIGWLTIFNDSNTLETRRKGYGTKMLLAFEKFISRTQSGVSKIIVIPKGFGRVTKNYLCTFYEKAGYIQEEIGRPYYIKTLSRYRMRPKLFTPPDF